MRFMQMMTFSRKLLRSSLPAQYQPKTIEYLRSLRQIDSFTFKDALLVLLMGKSPLWIIMELRPQFRIGRLTFDDLVFRIPVEAEMFPLAVPFNSWRQDLRRIIRVFRLEEL